MEKIFQDFSKYLLEDEKISYYSDINGHKNLYILQTKKMIPSANVWRIYLVLREKETLYTELIKQKILHPQKELSIKIVELKGKQVYLTLEEKNFHNTNLFYANFPLPSFEMEEEVVVVEEKNKCQVKIIDEAQKICKGVCEDYWFLRKDICVIKNKNDLENCLYLFWWKKEIISKKLIIKRFLSDPNEGVKYFV